MTQNQNQKCRYPSISTPVGTPVPSTQILIYNTIFCEKKVGFLGDMTDSRTGPGNNQNDPRTSCSAGKEGSAQNPTTSH